MKLIDNNIVIYSALEEYSYLRKIFKEKNVFVSEITLLEVLGYSNITEEQERYFHVVFSLMNIIPVSSEIISIAIEIRKKYKLTVGDSIIAASAKLLDLVLLTNNVSDFKDLQSITIHNPINKK